MASTRSALQATRRAVLGASPVTRVTVSPSSTRPRNPSSCFAASSPNVRGTAMSTSETTRHFASTPSPSSPAAPQQGQDRPLDGITVVSLEQAIAGPFCTRQLADLGARVIKVERPGVGDFARQYDARVDGMSSHFVWTNRNKESLALDLKNGADLEALSRLVAKADVLVQNLAPGAAARLGLSHDALKDEHPALIVCDISGYGQDGPYRDKKAYDLLIQSEAGMLSVTGTRTEPAKVGISAADIAAGMYAYSNILSALFRRARTGLGRRIDISMLESMAEWMGFPMYYAYGGAPGPVPNGAAHASISPYGPFEAGDGNSVMLGIQNEREWAGFCDKVLRDPGLASDPRFAGNAARVENNDALKAIIVDAFSKLSAAEVVERLDGAAIANANVNELKDVWAHPQLSSRNRWAEVDTPVGRIPALIPPGSEPAEEARMEPVPALGAHNDKIFAELGIKRG